MKKTFLFIILIVSFLSCEENVKFNNPSFQALKDNVFWRATATTATININNGLTITAYTSNEQVVLRTSSTAISSFTLGQDDITTATYTITNENNTTTYSTGTTIGDGQISITEYDMANNTITGSFKFNAVNQSAIPGTEASINFQQGVFYKLPITP
ncbi:DUF6252 family protein [Flavobacterium algicola]|uniref:DUF6252 family protein n=1 Tax=Flavobacterium algicola TaxID=556529 RepID=UPI001EFD3001|nr:DUF6252 family protein [Flavobacterium algicola]MCG9791681.1 DUF6252 family protein [Flavobacterium algicola]